MSDAPEIGPPLRLTEREQQIVRCISGGLSNKEIARQLGLAERTVGTYLERLYARNLVHSRAELAARWIGGQSQAESSAHWRQLDRSSLAASSRAGHANLLRWAAILSFAVAWPLGALLAWLAPGWSRTVKVVATAIYPGGVFLSLYLVHLHLSVGGACGGSAMTPTTCSGPPGVAVALIQLIWVLVFVGPLLPSAVLSLGLLRPRL